MGFCFTLGDLSLLAMVFMHDVAVVPCCLIQTPQSVEEIREQLFEQVIKVCITYYFLFLGIPFPFLPVF